MSLLSCWVYVSKRNIFWHQEQRPTGVETVNREDNFSRSTMSSLLYCSNIARLNNLMSLEYDATKWMLFIDSSNRALKVVLVHNGNSFSSIPIEHSIQMKETHNSMNHLLFGVNYQEHK